jgi:hypothetical protein
MKSQYEMLKLSAFNAQGLRVIIVVGEVRAVKMYVGSSGGAQEEGKRG